MSKLTAWAERGGRRVFACSLHYAKCRSLSQLLLLLLAPLSLLSPIISADQLKNSPLFIWQYLEWGTHYRLSSLSESSVFSISLCVRCTPGSLRVWNYPLILPRKIFLKLILSRSILTTFEIIKQTCYILNIRENLIFDQNISKYSNSLNNFILLSQWMASKYSYPFKVSIIYITSRL